LLFSKFAAEVNAGATHRRSLIQFYGIPIPNINLSWPWTIQT